MVSWQGREVISLFINPRLLSFTLTAGMTPAVGPTWRVVPFQPQSEVTYIKSTYIPYIKWSNWYRTDYVMMNNTKVVIGAFVKVCWIRLYSLESRQKRSNRWNLFLFSLLVLRWIASHFLYSACKNMSFMLKTYTNIILWNTHKTPQIVETLVPVQGRI